MCYGSKKEYFSCLEKVNEWLFGDRPGPVWLDIPMDVQSQELNENDLDLYTSKIPNSSSKKSALNSNQPKSTDIEKAQLALSMSEKPIILVGNGLRLQ